MNSFFSSLFVGSLSCKSERTWKDALKLCIPFVFVFLTLNYEYLQPLKTPLSPDGHALQTLGFAYQNAYCGKTAHAIGGVITPASGLDTPINRLLFENDSQVAAHCLTAQFGVMNENSLSVLYTYVFKIYPSITLNQVNIVFTILKVAALILFAFMLFRLGMSPVYVLSISLFSHCLFYIVDVSHRFSIYSFFISNYFFLVSICIIYLYGLKKYSYKFIPLGIFIGAYAAYYSNFRTSHSVIVFYVLAVSLWFIYIFFKNLSSKLRALLLTGLSFSSLSIGFCLYNSTFIKPIHEAAKAYNSTTYTYHSIFHPLVLALGLAPSDLTTREGIAWSDGVGPTLAQKIDPSVVYLAKNYDKALCVYYFKLWLYFSGEMLDIYKHKFKNFSTLKTAPYIENITYNVKNTKISNNILLSISWLKSQMETYGKVWFILLASFSLLGIFRKKFSSVGLFLSVSVVGSCCLLLLESVMIHHHIEFTYHSLVNALFVMILLYYVQIIINFLFHLFPNYQKRREVINAC